MTKLVFCRLCCVEMAGIALADGSVAVICHECDLIGFEHEVSAGGPFWAAGIERKRASGRRTNRDNRRA